MACLLLVISFSICFLCFVSGVVLSFNSNHHNYRLALGTLCGGYKNGLPHAWSSKVPALHSSTGPEFSSPKLFTCMLVTLSTGWGRPFTGQPAQVGELRLRERERESLSQRSDGKTAALCFGSWHACMHVFMCTGIHSSLVLRSGCIAENLKGCLVHVWDFQISTLCQLCCSFSHKLMPLYPPGRNARQLANVWVTWTFFLIIHDNWVNFDIPIHASNIFGSNSHPPTFFLPHNTPCMCVCVCV